MQKVWGECRYWTAPVVANDEGFRGLQLHGESHGTTGLKAECLFWDACGQYFIRTFDTDVPVPVIEELIAEAKKFVNVS
jgi:hypothetical protein